MKKNFALIFATLFVLAVFLSACGSVAIGPNGDAMTQAERDAFDYEILVKSVTHGEDYVIEWRDRGMEVAIRQLLEKPEGDILHSDVWDIHTLNIGCTSSEETGYVLASADLSRPLEPATYTKSILNSVTYELTDDVPWIRTLADLMHFDGLQKLSIGDNSMTTQGALFTLDISGLGQCRNLEILSIYQLKLTALEDIAACTGLRVLELGQIECGSLEPLSTLRNLERLSLHHIASVDLMPLVNLSVLETIIINDCEVNSLDPLSEIPGLKALALNDGTTFPSLEPLTQTQLEYLSMDCWQVGLKTDLYDNLDYAPLSRIPTLIYLDLTNHRKVDASLCTAILENAPNLKYLRVDQTAAAHELDEPEGLIFYGNNL